MTTSDRDAVIRKIEALLAKAASTDFQAEAEAFAAKAQELMARYLVEQHELGTDREHRLERRAFAPAGAYAAGRVRMLCQIARANGVYSYWTKGEGPATVFLFGRADVLDLVLVTFGLLDAQLVRQVATVGAGRHDVRAFRHAFVLGFGAAIARRLHAQLQRVERDSPGVGLVLADLLSEAERFFRAEEPGLHLRSSAASLSSWDGMAAGQRAGADADLGGTRLRGRAALGR